MQAQHLRSGHELVEADGGDAIFGVERRAVAHIAGQDLAPERLQQAHQLAAHMAAPVDAHRAPGQQPAHPEPWPLAFAHGEVLGGNQPQRGDHHRQ